MQIQMQLDQHLNNLSPIITRLHDLVSNVTAILLFGSVVSGYADEASDYDLLILTKNAIEREQQRQIKSQLREEFDQFDLDLIFSSEQALCSSLPYEPSRRFWLENATLLWGQWPEIEDYPPLAKGALLSRLSIIAAEIELGESEESLSDQARIGLDALEHLLHLKLALAEDYRNQAIRDNLTALLGEDALHIIRLTPEKITASSVENLYSILRQLQAQVAETIKKMPKTEADYRWKLAWQENESTETIAVSSSIDR